MIEKHRRKIESGSVEAIRKYIKLIGSVTTVLAMIGRVRIDSIEEIACRS
jgi:hypothetical protein